MNVSERIRTLITNQKEGGNMALKVGDIVRNKDSGELGKIAKSTYGIKVKGRDKDGVRWKTNGYAPEYIARYWEVVDE